ncbi:hypothetical protein QUF80_00375 [Desulfococcaceae bacterium HSG8]|nr:hypothetical protein [Desulfococcaceae bacterium HSG8]
MTRKKIIILTFLIITIARGNTPALDIGSVDIHGFISQGYLQTDKNNYLADTEDGTFQFNEMGINFSTKLSKRLRVGMQFFARDLGVEGNDELVQDWAFADYRWQEWLGLRVGKVKLIHALYSEAREMDMLRTGVMLPQSVYNELWRDTLSTIKGIAAYGNVSLGKMGSLFYDVQWGTLDVKSDGGFAKAFEISLSDYGLKITDMDMDDACILAARWNTPLRGLRAQAVWYEIKGLTLDGNLSVPVGENIISTRMNYEAVSHDGYTFSLEYTWEDMILASEYTSNDFEGRWNWNLGQGWQPRPRLTSEGWYVSGSYQFTDWFTLGLCYSEFYPDKDDKDGKTKENDFEAWLKTTTLSTRFDINEYWTFKLETNYNDGFGAYSPADNPDGLDQRWFLFAAKMTFSF